MLHKDGTKIPVLFHGQIAYDTHHTMLQTHCSFEDISDKNKVEHLNKVLTLIRDVNQAIVRVKNSDKLLQESCEILTSSDLYNYVWIQTTQNSQNKLYHSSKREEEFKTFKEKISNGWSPTCIDLFKKKSNDYIFINDTNHSCSACPIKGDANVEENAYILQLHHNDLYYGYLIVSSFSKFDADELTLLKEVAGDIAYGIYNIETEQILKENEERYRFAIEGATDGLWDWNISQDVVYYSPRYKEMLGYKDDELQNSFESWEKLLHPQDKEQTFLNIKAAKKGQTKRYQNIHRLRHKDGHWVWIHSRGQTIFDENDNAIRMIGSHTDITKLKESENKLKISNEKFEKAFDNTPNIIMLSNLKTGKIYDVNKTFETIFEYKKEEVIGETTIDIELWFNNEDRQKYIDDFHKNSNVNGDIYTFYTKNKRQVTAKVYASLVTIDNQEYILAVAEDITERNKLYNLLQDSQAISHLGSWELNGNNGALLWSDETYRIFEADPKQSMTFAKFINIVHPDERQTVSDSFEKSIQEHSKYHIEHRLLFADGHIKHVVERGEHFYDNNSKHVHTIGTVQDITEQFLAEDEIKKRDTILKSVFQVLPDLLFIMDANGIILQHRVRDDDNLYIKPEMFIGKDIRDVLPPNVAEIFNEKFEIIKKDLSLNIFKYELEIKGEIRHFEARMSQLPVDNHFMAIVSDISEQVSYEQRLVFQSELLEHSLAATNVIDENGMFSYINKAYVNMWGYDTKDEIIGTVPNEYCTDVDLIPNIMSKVKKEGESIFQFKALKKDTSTFEAFMAVKYFEHIGKKYYMGSTMDITELKRKDEMLINQSRHAAMGEMIGMIAHQWRQPLSTISMDANNMLLDIAMQNLDISSSEAYAKSISQQTQHLSKTIDDFRNFFKPDKVISKVNLKDVLTQTMSIVADSLKNNNIKLISSFEAQKQVKAYPRELMQVFVNIITNSKDALTHLKRDNAVINVRVYEDDKYINTQICDNGGGIEADILSKVFDPYFSTKDEKTGTGLGLYMSKMIIEDHLCGMIEVENKDNGACFKVSLLKEKGE